MQDNSHLRNKYQVTKASLDQDFVNENYQIQNTRSESDTTVDEVDMLEQSLRVQLSSNYQQIEIELDEKDKLLQLVKSKLEQIEEVDHGQ